MKHALFFKRVNDNAIIPCYKHEGDSGMDAFSCETATIKAGCVGMFSTGIAAEIPDGFELQVRPRSGLSSRGIVGVLGTVDCGYRGEIKAMLMNLSGCDYTVMAGDRIAQFVLAKVSSAEIVEVEEIATCTDRGCDGFGSTGR